MYFALDTEIPHEVSDEYLSIEKGLGSDQILQILDEKKVLRQYLATKIYLRFIRRDITLEAGDYLFPSPVSPLRIVEQLQNGKTRTKTITVPEGWTRFEIAALILAEFPADPPLEKDDVLALMDDVNPILDFDSLATNLEGYLYPSTYQFPWGTHPKKVIERMVRQFRSVWQAEWDEMAWQIGRSRREIIVVASLIEKECQVPSERTLVASVIYNRLQRGIPLGMDATNVYIAKMLDRWDGILHKSDLEIDHPYNTRKIQDLPPGPIGSVGRYALEAALNPKQTDYLYYVLNVEARDGTHHFYENGADFSKGKAKYQKWLKGQRAD